MLSVISISERPSMLCHLPDGTGVPEVPEQPVANTAMMYRNSVKKRFLFLFSCFDILPESLSKFFQIIDVIQKILVAVVYFIYYVDSHNLYRSIRKEIYACFR